MAKISSFIICDSVNNAIAGTGNNISQLINPMCVVRPEFIPGNYSFGIAVGVTGLKMKENKTVRITIKNPQMGVVHDSGDLLIPPIEIEDDECLPKELEGFMMCFEVRNMPVKEEGIYSFVLSINQETIGNCDIPIYLRKKP